MSPECTRHGRGTLGGEIEGDLGRLNANTKGASAVSFYSSLRSDAALEPGSGFDFKIGLVAEHRAEG